MPEHVLSSALEFDDILALDEYVSQHWQKHYVLITIDNEAVLDAILKRPYFVFVSIDAPIGVRWQRFKARCAKHGQDLPSLEDFVVRNDDHMYNSPSSLAALSARAQIRILNSATTLKQLSSSLDALNLMDPARLRPTWDQYFMQLANLAARRSNCMRRQVGCVVVREKRVISTGYNGTPRNVANCNEGGCPRCNSSVGRGGAALSTCLCLHAEENALLEAGRERIGDAAVLYCNTCGQLHCSAVSAHANVWSQLPVPDLLRQDCSGWDQRGCIQPELSYGRRGKSTHTLHRCRSCSLSSGQSAKIFKEAGVHLRQFSPVCVTLLQTAKQRLTLVIRSLAKGW